MALTRCGLSLGLGRDRRDVVPEQRLAGLGVKEVQMLAVEPQLGLAALADPAGGIKPSHHRA